MRIVLSEIEELPSTWDKAKLPIQRALKRLGATINTVWESEHTVDGGHDVITPTSVRLQGATVGVWTNVPYDADRYYGDGTTGWVVASTDVNYFKLMRVGEMVTVMFSVYNTVVNTASSPFLYIKMPEVFAVPTSGAGATAQLWHGGTFTWSDVGAGTTGMGTVSAQVLPSAATPSTVLQLARISPTNATFANFPTTTDLSISGICTFPVNPNNLPGFYSF